MARRGGGRTPGRGFLEEVASLNHSYSSSSSSDPLRPPAVSRPDLLLVVVADPLLQGVETKVSAGEDGEVRGRSSGRRWRQRCGRSLELRRRTRPPTPGPTCRWSSPAVRSRPHLAPPRHLALDQAQMDGDLGVVVQIRSQGRQRQRGLPAGCRVME
jgi:hypothetical protein